MRGHIGVLVAVVAAVGCGDAAKSGTDSGSPLPQYELSIVCGDKYPDRCPPGEACPSVPLDSTSCVADRLNADVPLDAGVAWGCVVNLPLVASIDGGPTQASCYCGTYSGIQQDASPDWGSWHCNSPARTR